VVAGVTVVAVVVLKRSETDDSVNHTRSGAHEDCVRDSRVVDDNEHTQRGVNEYSQDIETWRLHLSAVQLTC
jgi:hypothetical protein